MDLDEIGYFLFMQSQEEEAKKEDACDRDARLTIEEPFGSRKNGYHAPKITNTD